MKDSAFDRLGGSRVLEVMDHLTQLRPGRSSKYGLRRHGILRAGLYRPFFEDGDAAQRARALRLCGSARRARTALESLVRDFPRSAQAHAWLWEAALAAKARVLDMDFGGIDRAVKLEPGNAWWRVWRGLGWLAMADNAHRLREEGRRGGPAFRVLARRAEGEFAAALRLDKSLGLAHAVLARVQNVLKRPDAALRSLDRAVKLEPRQGWIRRLRAAARLGLGDVDGFAADGEIAVLLDEGAGYFADAAGASFELPADKRIEAANRFLEGRPECHWMLVYRGDLRRLPEVNDFTGAIADFEAALRIRPACSWGWAYLSRAVMAAGDGVGARKSIEKAIALKPRVGWFHVWRGEVRRRLGNPAGSILDFNRGLALDPDYEFGYAWRGGALRSLEQPKEALADLELAAALDPVYAWTPHERSLALRKLGRVEEGLRALEEAVALDPKFAFCADPAGFPAALRELEGGGEGSARARAWKGEILLRMGNFPDAKRELDQALADFPRRPLALAWRGRALEGMGRVREALGDFDRSIKADPRHANVWAWRARLRRRSGDPRGALRDFKRAARLDRKSAWIMQWKGELELELGRWETAVQDLSVTVELDGRNWEARLLRAKALGRLGRWEEAKADLARAGELRGG